MGPASRLPHGQKLSAAVRAVPLTGDRQPNDIGTDATQHGEVVVLAVFHVQHNGHLQSRQLLPTCRKALCAKAKIGTRSSHVIKAGAAVSLVQRFEQSLLGDVLAVVAVEQGGQRCSATGIIEILFDDAVVSKRFPIFPRQHAAGRVGAQKHTSVRSLFD